MADTKYNDNFYSLTNNNLLSQSILDVFVLQDILDAEDATKLKSRFKTNREVEDFLVKSRIVTKDTINKAYSIIYKLPYVELKAIAIPDDLIRLLPEKVVRRFGIIPFGREDNLVRIAISRPADLLAGFRNGLGKIFSEKGLDIELFVTGESDFYEAIKQYGGKSDKILVKKGSLPIVFLRNQIIPEEYLKKLPRDFIEKYRLVVFGQNQRGYFLLATALPDSPITLKIIDFIKQENSIKVETFATSDDDIKYAISLYDGDIKAIQEENKKAQKTENSEKTEEESDNKEKPQPQAKETSPKDQKSFKERFNNWLESSNEPEITIDENPVNLPQTPDQPQPESQPAPKIEVKAPEKEEAAKEQKEEKPKEPQPQPTQPEEPSVSIDSENNIGALVKEDITTEDQLSEVAKRGFIPEIVASIIDYAINKHSSDIHVEPESKSLRVRCRIDGILREAIKLPLGLHPAFVSRIKILSKLKIDESRIPQDGRFEVGFKSREVDVRVSTLPTVHGEKVVMRILDKTQGILSLEDLGMQGSAFEETINSIGKPYGVILVTGPTGSGKSTTLYAILNRISLPGVNIITLEDPVEYEISGINQCQIKPEIGFSFASGLRSILRQDPNIIMVGEIRDAETAGMTTHAALTGHLVLSTLHTNDTAGALPRLINMGVEPFLITSSINLVIAQRLVRRICPKCKEEMKVPSKLIDQLKVEIEKIPVTNTKDRERIPTDFKLYAGKGCDECNHGFRGRVGIFEVMSITPEIEELAVSKRPANEIKSQSLKQGMITMKQDGILKAFAGLTTIDEVFQAVINN